ncbi:MAG: DUF362 domain-containing protein [Planctomycetota bacterium]
MNDNKDKQLSRREFASRVGKAGLSIAAAGFVAWKTLDTEGPKPGVKSEELVTLPDFSIPTRQGQVMSVVKGSDRIKNVDKAIELLGGIERFVNEGETVVIKPNVAFASAPMLGATARPELVAEVVRLCLNKALAKKVIVTDNPINNPRSCFTLSGIGKAASQAGAEVVLPKDHFFKPTTLEGGRLIKEWPIFYEPFAKVDKVIGISPIKDHQRSGASGFHRLRTIKEAVHQ